MARRAKDGELFLGCGAHRPEFSKMEQTDRQVEVSFEIFIAVENKVRERFGMRRFDEQHIEQLRRDVGSAQCRVLDTNYLEWLVERIDRVNRVATLSAIRRKGDYVICTGLGGVKGFMIRCPQCGEDSASSEGHHFIVHEEPLTFKPNFKCPHRGCGAIFRAEVGRIVWT